MCRDYEVMGDFGRIHPEESQGLLVSPFTSGSSRKAMGNPCLTEQVLRDPAPQLPNKESAPPLSTKSSA